METGRFQRIICAIIRTNVSCPSLLPRHMECIHFCAWPRLQHYMHEWKMEGMIHYTFIRSVQHVYFCLVSALQTKKFWCFFKIFARGWLHAALVCHCLCVFKEHGNFFCWALLSVCHTVGQMSRHEAYCLLEATTVMIRDSFLKLSRLR